MDQGMASQKKVVAVEKDVSLQNERGDGL